MLLKIGLGAVYQLHICTCMLYMLGDYKQVTSFCSATHPEHSHERARDFPIGEAGIGHKRAAGFTEEGWRLASRGLLELCHEVWVGLNRLNAICQQCQRLQILLKARLGEIRLQQHQQQGWESSSRSEAGDQSEIGTADTGGDRA